MAVRKLKMWKFYNHSSHGWRRRPWQEEALPTRAVSRGHPSTCYVTSLWSRHSHISTSHMRKWRLKEFEGCLGHTAQFSSVQSLSRVWLFATPCTAARQVSLSVTNSRSLLKRMSIKSVMPFKHLIFCCPLLLLPSVFPRIRVFSKESVLRIRWPKYWSFSISPSNEYSGLISFGIDWFDLLAVQGTLKSLLQDHNSNLWFSAFFTVQLSHPNMITGKTIALTIQIFVSKWCLCFSMHCLGLS